MPGHWPSLSKHISWVSVGCWTVLYMCWWKPLMAGPCVHATYPFIQCLVQKRSKHATTDRLLLLHCMSRQRSRDTQCHGHTGYVCSTLMHFKSVGSISEIHCSFFESQVFISGKVFQNVLHEFWTNLQLCMCPAMHLHGIAVTNGTSCQTWVGHTHCTERKLEMLTEVHSYASRVVKPVVSNKHCCLESTTSNEAAFRVWNPTCCCIFSCESELGNWMSFPRYVQIWTHQVFNTCPCIWHQGQSLCVGAVPVRDAADHGSSLMTTFVETCRTLSSVSANVEFRGSERWRSD